jgi:hypothetical protein
MANDPPSMLPTRLPNADQAIIPQSKVRDYLLSLTHPIGRFKAVFFRALGYKPEQWRRLQMDLLRIARSGEAALGQRSPYARSTKSMVRLKGRPDAELIWLPCGLF